MKSKKLALNGPDLWMPLAAEVGKAYGSCLIAGGAPRDWIVNKNLIPRDIDFFVPVESELDLELGIPDLPEFDDLRLMTKGQSGGEPYEPSEGREPNIVAVLEGWAILRDPNTGRREEMKVNIIGKTPDKIADPVLMCQDFDHSLCKMFVDPLTFEVVILEDAQKTLDTGVIQVYNQDKRTRRRLERMMKRGKSYSDRFSFKMDKPTAERTAELNWAADTSSIKWLNDYEHNQVAFRELVHDIMNPPVVIRDEIHF